MFSLRPHLLPESYPALLDTIGKVGDEHSILTRSSHFTLDQSEIAIDKHNAELRGTAPGANIPKSMFL